MFRKILVANRGEIACRIMRTTKRLGIESVAVYSDADKNSIHVQMADEAHCIGPAPSQDSYLQMQTIIDVAKRTGAQGIHPGYGFLSENPDFVRLLDSNGIAFIGPSANSMAQLGDKLMSKRIARAAGVSVIPGYDGPLESGQHAIKIANELGYPVMLKPSGGGGGKGMYVVYSDAETLQAFESCTSLAISAFGDPRILIERYIERPRHIEIQLLGDKHGNIVYLPERECSIQRRNQKVIEESPSPSIDPATRKLLGEQAVALARGVDYYSAGTCEFLFDDVDKKPYFLELNARLQVEHAITECVTNIDIVEQMIRIAANQKLGLSQSQITFNGWAVESRIYAEDPKSHLPSTGKISRYIEPAISDSIRCDTGVCEGAEISVDYDPLICKLISHAPTRTKAIDQMKMALDQFDIRGLKSNISLLYDVFQSQKFQAGLLSTRFLSQEYPDGFTASIKKYLIELACVSVLVHIKRQQQNFYSEKNRKSYFSDGSRTLFFQFTNPETNRSCHLEVQFEELDVTSISAKHREHFHPVKSEEHETVLRVSVKGYDGQIMLKSDWNLSRSPHSISASLFYDNVEETKVEGEKNEQTDLLANKENQTIFKNNAEESGAIFVSEDRLNALLLGFETPLGFKIQIHGIPVVVTCMTPLQHELSVHMHQRPKLSVNDENHLVQSPMPGRIVSVNVKPGDVVYPGTEMIVVEAMKMQNVIRATPSSSSPESGTTVLRVCVEKGQTVAADQVLIEFERKKTTRPPQFSVKLRKPS